MPSDTPWTDAKIARLTQLWAEGLPTAEIARRLNLSKNAVVGKAHRLRLSERPSPIKPREGEQPHRIVPAPPPGWRTGRPTLPRLPCLRLPLAAAAATPDGALLPSPSPSPSLEANALGTPPRPRAAHPCCWPLGEPGSPRFRYCDAPVLAGKPYCGAHCQLAYTRRRAAPEVLYGRPGEGR